MKDLPKTPAPKNGKGKPIAVWFCFDDRGVLFLVDNKVTLVTEPRENMLSLSVTTGYAIKALMCLESGDCVPRHISDIARCTGVPRAYLAKILNTLSQQGLVQTRRGYRGGISLARGAGDISLLQIVEAVEGDQWLGECLLGMQACDILTICPTHDFWARIRREITEVLRKTSLAALITSQRRGGLQANGVPERKDSSACACSQNVPA